MTCSLCLTSSPQNICTNKSNLNVDIRRPIRKHVRQCDGGGGVVLLGHCTNNIVSAHCKSIRLTESTGTNITPPRDAITLRRAHHHQPGESSIVIQNYCVLGVLEWPAYPVTHTHTHSGHNELLQCVSCITRNGYPCVRVDVRRRRRRLRQ